MGLETKFGRNDDILWLQKRLLQHFENHGLDTMQKGYMVSIITSYPRYTMEEAVSAGRDQKFKYDKYDHENSQDAVQFLLLSLSPELMVQMYQNCSRKETFFVHWMHQSHNISQQRFTKEKYLQLVCTLLQTTSEATKLSIELSNSLSWRN